MIIFVVVPFLLWLTFTESKTLRFSLRYLETNTWHITYGAINVLVDPVLTSPLDFGLPFMYTGKKRVIDGNKELVDLCRKCQLVLLSQGFDDHTHKPTIKAISKLQPDMHYICPPSAKSILNSCGIRDNNIKYLSPKEVTKFNHGGQQLDIIATTGALLGPPWQQEENGYILRSYKSSSPTIYYEPHCMHDIDEISRYQADYVITPVVAQQLPLFTLVDGGNKALILAETLRAKYIVPMANGELDQSGLLAKVIRTSGSKESFVSMVQLSRRRKIAVLDVIPGKEILLTEY